MEQDKNSAINEKGAARKSIRVEFSHPVSIAIAIGGTFNDRKRDAIRMQAVSEGRWRREWVPDVLHE